MPPRGRSITDYFRRPPPKKPRTDDEAIYDNIVVGSSQGNTPKRTSPSPRERVKAATGRENSTLSARQPGRTPDAAATTRSESTLPHRADTERRSSASTQLDGPLDSPTPAAVLSASQTDLIPNASFTSTTTLPATPRLSQSTSGSSRRVIVGGMQGVTTSESEGEDMEDSVYAAQLHNITSSESSSEEDNDLEMLGAFYSKLKSPSLQATTLIGGHGLRSRTSKAGELLLKPKKKAYDQGGKYSLAALLARQSDEHAQDMEVALARSKLDAMESDHPSRSGTASRDELNEEALAELMSDDDDGHNAAQLRMAMERTEVLHRELVWHFFSGATHSVSQVPWPNLKPTGWLSLMHDPVQREEMILSGFWITMVHQNAFPDEVLVWMLDELWNEPREDLCHAYVQILLATETNRRLASHVLESIYFRSSLLRMGATYDVITTQETLKPRRETSENTTYHVPTSLRWLLMLVESLALTKEALQYDITMRDWNQITEKIIRISLDENVQKDGLLQSALSRVIDVLLSTILESSIELQQNLYYTVQHPLLQLRLMMSLPTTSAFSHKFRRRLALAFFLNDPDVLALHAQDPKDLLLSPDLFSRILDHLRTHPSFSITKRTDYVAFRTSITALDIAVDAGFSDFKFLSNRSSSNTALASVAREAEDEFNRNISLLADTVRGVEQQIHDAGAANMTQTMAKETARRLVTRLEFAARTREKRMKNLFAQDDEDEERDFMQNWMVRRGPETSEETGG